VGIGKMVLSGDRCVVLVDEIAEVRLFALDWEAEMTVFKNGMFC
jgi:hypothetical protein